MDFNTNQPIYLQITDIICDKILNLVWDANERIPSVRELGADLQVNPNTAMRAYEWLESREIIYNKRGVGFFVSPEARDSILMSRREHFFNVEIPEIAKKMELLGITKRELMDKLKID